MGAGEKVGIPNRVWAGSRQRIGEGISSVVGSGDDETPAREMSCQERRLVPCSRIPMRKENEGAWFVDGLQVERGEMRLAKDMRRSFGLTFLSDCRVPDRRREKSVIGCG